MRVLYAMPAVLAAVAYLVWRHFAAQVYVGDLPPFDLRFYGFADAQAYLTGLTEGTRAVYLGPLHRADLALMLALTVTLALPVWRRGWLGCVPAALYLGFDLLENRMVAGLLTHGLHEIGEVATLSVITGLKFGFLAVAGLLAVWGLWRRAG